VRSATRQPYPVSTQARRIVAVIAFRLISAILTPFFRRPVRLADLRTARILVLKPCCLGDVVFSTPLVRELRRALPEARISFAVGAHSRAAILGSPHVDAILDTGAVGNGTYGLHDLLKLAGLLRREQFDACFVLERSAVLSLIPLLAGIPRRIGIDSGGRGFSLTAAVKARPPRPESELYLDLLRAIGGWPLSGRLEFFPSDNDRVRASMIAREKIPASTPWVIVHGGGGVNPGMVLTRKRWPVESFRQLIQKITSAGGIALVVGAAEDRELIGDPGSVNLVGTLELGELAALASMANAYVGNDSGPAHLAEAAGARVIVLFGPSDPIVYGPRSPTSVALTAGLWCSPCFEDGRFPPCANVLCMPGIAVERVWRELAPLLSRSAVHP